tara:strand:+ start:9251 stop:9685 length:435 start_codon:yes stop_codon:yes gene_type:complete
MIILDHIVLNATNVEKTLRFYCDLLETEPERWAAFQAGEVPFPSVRLSETLIIDIFPPEMWRPKAPPSSSAAPSASHPNLNHFCLALPAKKWRAILDRLQQAQTVSLSKPESVWGARGYGQSFYLKDPDGTIVELKTYEKVHID